MLNSYYIISELNSKIEINLKRNSNINVIYRSNLKDYNNDILLNDFIKNYNSTVGNQPGGFRNGSAAEKYLSINPYWFQEHFSGQSKEFLTEAMAALKGADWYDESDAQVDYFNTAYYVDINIGKWNKPYTVE